MLFNETKSILFYFSFWALILYTLITQFSYLHQQHPAVVDEKFYCKWSVDMLVRNSSLRKVPGIVHREVLQPEVSVGQGGQLYTSIPEKKITQNTPKYPKFLPVYPKVDQHVIYCTPKISSSQAKHLIVKAELC